MPQAIISIEQREAHRWTAEVEVGFPICRRQVVNAASFDAIMDLVRSTHDAMLPQPKPAVEAEARVVVTEQDVAGLIDAIGREHLTEAEPAVFAEPGVHEIHYAEAEPFDPDLHFVITPEQANDLRADETDDARSVEPADHPVTVAAPKRRGRPPRARDSNDDGA